MFEKIGVCIDRGRSLCRIKAGGLLVEVSKSGHRYLSSINGRTMVISKSDKEMTDKGIPVLGTLIKSVAVKGSTVRVASNGTGIMDSLVTYVKDNLEPAEVFVLDIKPDEMQENSPSETASLHDCLAAYHAHLTETTRNIEEASHLAGVLLKANLDKDMWGTKDVKAALNGVRADLVSLNTETLEPCIEKSGLATRYLMNYMGNSKAQVQSRAAASRVVDDFSMIKSFVSGLAQATYRLYDMDRIFKASTGYPATWFVMSSHLGDFRYEYENLLGNMVKLASIEANTIEPLIAWRVATAAA